MFIQIKKSLMVLLTRIFICIVLPIFFVYNTNAQLSFEIMLDAMEANKKKISKDDKYVIEEWLKPCLEFYKIYKTGKYRRFRRTELTRLFAKEVSKTTIVPGRTNVRDPKADKHNKRLNEFKEKYLITNKAYTYHVAIIDFISFYGKKMGIGNKYLGGRVPYNEYYRRHRILPSPCSYLNRIRLVWNKIGEEDKEKLMIYGIDQVLIDDLEKENPKCAYVPPEREEKVDCQQIEKEFTDAIIEAIQNNNARPLQQYFNAEKCYSFVQQDCLDRQAFTQEISDVLSHFYSAYYDDNKACCKERDKYLSAAYRTYLKNPKGFDKVIASKYNNGESFKIKDKMANLQRLLENDCPSLEKTPFHDAQEKVKKVKRLNDVITKDLKGISQDIIESNKDALVKSGLPPEVAAILNCYEEDIKQNRKGFTVNFKIRDCEDYSTVINDYGLGVVVSPHASVLTKLTVSFLRTLKEKENIDISGITIEITGLADGNKCSRCPAGQEIGVRYGGSKKVKIKLQPVTNFTFYEKNTKEKHVINFTEGEIIRTNLDLAGVRAHQVKVELQKLNIPLKTVYYGYVSPEKNKASSRGVSISLKFPDAYKEILKTSDVTVENIINYMIDSK